VRRELDKVHFAVMLHVLVCALVHALIVKAYLRA
jgi:hypothetical protein